jgi:hypothetical protein
MDFSGALTSPTPCEPCLKGKQMQSNIPKQAATRTDTVLERIHSDVCGPLPTQSHSGFRYFATFTDDKSRKVSVVGMREKSDLARHLKAFVARAELETGQKVRILRSDAPSVLLDPPIPLRATQGSPLRCGSRAAVSGLALDPPVG